MIKCLCDLIISILLIIITSPLMLISSILIYLKLGKPVIFKQERPGLHGKSFFVYKFRTMTDDRDGNNNLLPDSRRLTKLGGWLRKLSIDELPQLFNVIKGEMSLVGPRPLLSRYMPYYTAREKLRFTVKPGITGWAQIHGRNCSCWEERLNNDIWYVEHQSFSLDIKIMVLTFIKVFKSDGVAVDTTSIMLDLDKERTNNISN